MSRNTTKGGPRETALHHDHDPRPTKKEICHQHTANGGHPAKASFTIWLRKQNHRDGPVGSLAMDMRGDGGWPELATLEEYRAYLEKHSAPSFVHEALDIAWLEWVRWSS
jgi:hypothetical protein